MPDLPHDLRLRLAVLFLLTVFADQSPAADNPALLTDGWHSWVVAAAPRAQNWCCYAWRSGEARIKSCDLESRHASYSTSDDGTRLADDMQIYVQMQGGKARKIRTFSASCPVTITTKIDYREDVTADDSIDWLRRQIAPDSAVNSDALAAISIHDSQRSIDTLIAVAENRELDDDLRKHALFWLANVGSDDAIEYFDKLLSGT